MDGSRQFVFCPKGQTTNARTIAFRGSFRQRRTGSLVEQVQPKADQPLAGAVTVKNMFYVYVLKSLKNGKRYVGCTGKKPEQRLAEHNSGTDDYTRSNKPFELVHAEIFENKTESLKREKFLKSGQGRKFLDSIIPR